MEEEARISVRFVRSNKNIIFSMMAQTEKEKLIFPVWSYKVGGYAFAEKVRRRLVFWATHLGEDVRAKPGTEVFCIGDGEVVWSEMRKGSKEKRNWGGIVVVKHESRIKNQESRTKNFYSVYGHLRDLVVSVGEKIERGRKLGVVAKGLTSENGWWKIPHLHFGIYVGPWDDKIVPGFKRMGDGRTKIKWWRCPSKFIEEYNLEIKRIENGNKDTRKT